MQNLVSFLQSGFSPRIKIFSFITIGDSMNCLWWYDHSFHYYYIILFFSPLTLLAFSPLHSVILPSSFLPMSDQALMLSKSLSHPFEVSLSTLTSMISIKFPIGYFCHSLTLTFNICNHTCRSHCHLQLNLKETPPWCCPTTSNLVLGLLSLLAAALSIFREMKWLQKERIEQ